MKHRKLFLIEFFFISLKCVEKFYKHVNEFAIRGKLFFHIEVSHMYYILFIHLLDPSQFLVS